LCDGKKANVPAKALACPFVIVHLIFICHHTFILIY